jgi:hypothetical protein
MLVLLATLTLVAGEPPIDTLAPVWKLVPVIVRVVPPVVGPLVGVNELTVGAGLALPAVVKLHTGPVAV